MSTVKFYNMINCPFGQRAWIALLCKGVDFEYIEQNPYNKTPEWLAINPRGLVPTIQHNGKIVYESTICVEYVDEAWPKKSISLLPKDPFERAHVRIWSDHISRKIVPCFYEVLMKKTEEERDIAKENILNAVQKLCDAMSNLGPFFGGKEIGMVDIMLAPWGHRFETVTKHYRGFVIPERFARYHKWWKAVKEHPSVAATLQEDDELIGLYTKYADGTAESLVGHAVRGGKPLP